MADSQKTLEMLVQTGVVKSSDVTAASSLADETAVAALTSTGEDTGAKAAVIEGLDASGALVGIDSLGAIFGPIGLTGVVAKQVYDHAQQNLEAANQESEAQDYANETLYESTKDTLAVGNTRAREAIKEFDAGLRQAGYKEDSVSGNPEGASNTANLKNAAEKAIHDALVGEDMDTLLTRALEKAKKEGESGGALQEARDEAARKLAAAKALPDQVTTDDGYLVHNYEKDSDMRDAQEELDKAQKDLDRNEEQIKTLEKKLDRATEETAEARIRMNTAEDAVRAALKNATAPATGGSDSSRPSDPTPQTQALQQLLQQQASASQTLNTLLQANRKSAEDQAALFRKIMAGQMEFQAELDRFRAQLVNLQSTGVH